MIRVRPRRTTHLCLKDDPDTSFDTVLNQRALQLRTSCFVVYPSIQDNYTEPDTQIDLIPICTRSLLRDGGFDAFPQSCLA